jgi:glycosyltransferase involved in cell wall biosynthesis
MSPGKMFEYMAARRLIVSSDLPVIAEVLNEGNAVLCGPEEIDAWERALSRASMDADWRERLARKARRDVERYTYRSRVRQIFTALLGNEGRGNGS